MLDEVMRRCDRNGDGYLGFNEFTRYFLAQVPMGRRISGLDMRVTGH